MFCTPGLIFGATEGVGSRFHVLRIRTHFRRYRGRRVPFSYFALSDSFSAIPRASGPVFMFCAPRLIFGSTEGARSRFHVLRKLDSFSAVPSTSGPVFMFCASGLVFGGTECARSHFHVFCSRTCFCRCGGRQVPFSCFALPYSFSAEPRPSAPVFMFCILGLVFGGTEGVGSYFHILRARTRFLRYRGHRVPFSCFVLPGTFSTRRRASGLNFMFWALGLVFGATEGVGSRFIFSAPRLIFDGTEGVGPHFHVLRSLTHFRRYRGRPVPFSYFALPDTFSSMPSASGPVFMFCARELIFGGTEVSEPVFMFSAPGYFFVDAEGVRSRFHIFRSWTRFRHYRGRRIPF
jgi:hypothetical protein